MLGNSIHATLKNFFFYIIRVLCYLYYEACLVSGLVSVLFLFPFMYVLCCVNVYTGEILRGLKQDKRWVYVQKLHFTP